MRLAATTLDAPDARELAGFYRRLLGWEVAEDEPGWVTLRAAGGGAGLSFQTEAAYVRPVWPAGPDDPQMSMPLDIAGGALGAGGARAAPPPPPGRTIRRCPCTWISRSATWTRPGPGRRRR